MELADLYKLEARGSVFGSPGEPLSEKEAVSAGRFTEFPDADEAAMAQDDGLQWATDEARALEQEMEMKQRAQRVLGNHGSIMMQLQELAKTVSSAPRATSDGVTGDGPQNGAGRLETPEVDLADFERFSADKDDSAQNGPCGEVGLQPEVDEEGLYDLEEDIDDYIMDMDERELVLNEMEEAMLEDDAFRNDDDAWERDDDVEELEDRIQLGDMLDAPLVGSWSEDGSSGIMPEPLQAGIEPLSRAVDWANTQPASSGNNLPTPSTVTPPEERLAQRYADMAVQAALRSAMSKEPSLNAVEDLEVLGVME